MSRKGTLGVAVALFALSLGSARAEEAKAPLQIGGFVDVYYGSNFNDPKSQTNGGSNFDFRDSTFSLNLAEVVFQKGADPVGFRVDLNFGETTDWIHCGALSCDGHASREEPYKHLQQAYLTWASPQGITFDMGKFVTHMGAEVIESKDNWNYTRGLLFAWAIPYYHAGVRANWPISDKVFANAYVYNGWNNVVEQVRTLPNGDVETDDSKTYGAQIGLTPTPAFPVLLNWIGPEDGVFGPDADRDVYEAIATWHVNSEVSLMADYNYGRQDGGPGIGRQTYNGLALYGRWMKDPCAFAVRYETTDDDDNLMYGTGLSPKVKEFTLTAEHKVAQNMMVRVEYRHDAADENVFEDDKGGLTEDSQNRVVAGLIYSF